MAAGWTVRGSNPGAGEIFRTRPDRPCGPPSLLYNGCPIVKRPGRDVGHPLQSSAEVKVEVGLYLYPHLGLHGLLYGELHLSSTLPSKHFKNKAQLFSQTFFEVNSLFFPDPRVQFQRPGLLGCHVASGGKFSNNRKYLNIQLLLCMCLFKDAVNRRNYTTSNDTTGSAYQKVSWNYTLSTDHKT